MGNRVLIAAAAASLIAETPVASLVVETWPGFRDESRAAAGKAWAKDKGDNDRSDGGGRGGKAGGERGGDLGGTGSIGDALDGTIGGVGGAIGSTGNLGGVAGGEAAGSSNSTGGDPLGEGVGSPGNARGGAGGGAASGSGNSAGATPGGTSSPDRGGSVGGAGRSSSGGSRGTQTGGSAPSTPAAPSPSTAEPTTVGSIGGPSGVVGGPSLPSGLTPGSSDDRGSVVLAPSGVLLRGARQDFERVSRPLSPVPGTPMRVVQACWHSLAVAAIPFGAIRLDAASAGEAMQGPRGETVALLEARVIYARGTARQVRQSRIICRLDARGQVMALQ